MNKEDYCYDRFGQIKKPQTKLKLLPRNHFQDVSNHKYHCILN